MRYRYLDANKVLFWWIHRSANSSFYHMQMITVFNLIKNFIFLLHTTRNQLQCLLCSIFFAHFVWMRRIYAVDFIKCKLCENQSIWHWMNQYSSRVLRLCSNNENSIRFDCFRKSNICPCMCQPWVGEGISHIIFSLWISGKIGKKLKRKFTVYLRESEMVVSPIQRFRDNHQSCDFPNGSLNIWDTQCKHFQNAKNKIAWPI